MFYTKHSLFIYCLYLVSLSKRRLCHNLRKFYTSTYLSIPTSFIVNILLDFLIQFFFSGIFPFFARNTFLSVARFYFEKTRYNFWICHEMYLIYVNLRYINLKCMFSRSFIFMYVSITSLALCISAYILFIHVYMSDACIL